MRDKVHLVTGITGFVGGALALELLMRTPDRVLGMVRAGDIGALPRVRQAVEHAARAYGLQADALPWHRLDAVAGDIALPHCGVDIPPEVDVLWHSAASLRYEVRHQQEIYATNVDGTRNVLSLARDSGCKVANVISTAYVAGQYDGPWHEVPAESPKNHNHYERSKVASEKLAREMSGLDVRIFRPSIVVGHSRTLAATTFSGMYGFVRQLFQFRGVMDRLNAGLMDTRPLRFRASENMGANLITVDRVAEEVVAIGLRDDASGIYHITNPAPPLVGDTIRTIACTLGFRTPEFVAPDAELDWLDTQLDKRLDYYGSYVRGNISFDRSRADAALRGSEGRAGELPTVQRMIDWYIERLEAERAELPVAR